jgi:hypothetical protein
MLLAVALLGVALLLPVVSAHSTGTNDWTDWTHSQLWSADDPRVGPDETGTHGPMHAGGHVPHHADGNGSEAAYAHSENGNDMHTGAGYHHGPHSNEAFHHQSEYENSTEYHQDTSLNATHHHSGVYRNGTHYHDDTHRNGAYDDEQGIENDRWHDDASNTTTSEDWDDSRRHHGPGGCR